MSAAAAGLSVRPAGRRLQGRLLGVAFVRSFVRCLTLIDGGLNGGDDDDGDVLISKAAGRVVSCRRNQQESPIARART